ncbi:shieldin complex subunit 1 isoform X5 [Rousettus aegyptiacus]|uniref:shieldin complex subunit 1 isoform X5 n=1 Tax=Rousettus aegyptiacus TaxID=9407 RepID=UPI00168CDC20|nr:shieldin complex subunit 1 isoform X5 [Rousettus aegyptiacus]
METVQTQEAGRPWSWAHPSLIFYRTMATQEVTPGTQSEESNALDLPSACDIRNYMLQRPSQEAHSEAFLSVESLSIPASSDVDPGSRVHLGKAAVSHEMVPGATAQLFLRGLLLCHQE